MRARTARRPICGLSRRTLIGGIGTVLAIVAHAPLVAAHLANLWDRPHFQFAFLLLPLVGWLMWQRWPREEAYRPAPRLEAALLGGSCLILTIALWLNSPTLGAVSAILAIGLAILHVAGVRSLAGLLTPWLLLWFAVPPPLGFDLLLIAKMQSWTSRLTSQLLDLAGIDHLMAGNVLQVAGETFFVDQACSGVHSLFSLLAFTALLTVFCSRSFLRGALLLLSSLGWAVMANVIRVVAIAVAHVWWGLDLSAGWPHELLGLMTFALALGLTISTDRWLQFVAHMAGVLVRTVRRGLDRSRIPRRILPSAVARRYHESLRREESAARFRRGTRLRWTAAVAYCLLLAADVSGLTPEGARMWIHDPLRASNAQMMPARLAGLSQTGFERIDRDISGDFGSTSCVWTYTDDHASVVRVALDASFPGWHELSRCYQGQGWTLQQREVVEDEGLAWVEATFSRPSGEHACLVFSLAALDGTPLRPTAGQGSSRLIDRLNEQQSIQLQAFIESSGPVDDAQRLQARGLFVQLMHVWNAIAPHATQSGAGHG